MKIDAAGRIARQVNRLVRSLSICSNLTPRFTETVVDRAQGPSGKADREDGDPVQRKFLGRRQRDVAHAWTSGWKGVVSKVSDSRYFCLSGLGDGWVRKICTQREMLAIASCARGQRL
jgi:hypothetical protein